MHTEDCLCIHSPNYVVSPSKYIHENTICQYYKHGLDSCETDFTAHPQ